MTKSDAFLLPSAGAYSKALDSLSLSAKHRALLFHHFRAHRHTITATHLASLVGYKNYRAINLQYGKLGKRLGVALGPAFRPPPKAQASYSIASFIHPDADHNDWEWKLHGPLAEALRERKWHLKLP